jgi:hypothetical protein
MASDIHMYGVQIKASRVSTSGVGKPTLEKKEASHERKKLTT